MADLRIAGVSATDTGAGQPIVLLHSLLSDRASFDRIMPDLASRFRVITINLPGFGTSEMATGGLPGIADAIATFIRGVASDERVILLGNGYGAFLSLQLAIRHPALVSSLVLADCGARFSEPGREAFRAMSRIAGEKGLAAIADTAMRRLFAPEFQAAHPELMQDRREAFLRTNLDVFHQACAALAALDLSTEAASLAVPTLVLAGEQDEATPPEMARELAAIIPSADLRLLPGCAHVPPLQAPGEFLAAIAPFLGMIASKAA